MAELVPILFGLSSAKSVLLICRPISLPHLGRLVGLNFLGGSASLFLLSFPPSKGELQGGNACVGMDIGLFFFFFSLS